MGLGNPTDPLPLMSSAACVSERSRESIKKLNEYLKNKNISVTYMDSDSLHIDEKDLYKLGNKDDRYTDLLDDYNNSIESHVNIEGSQDTNSIPELEKYNDDLKKIRKDIDQSDIDMDETSKMDELD